MKGRAVKGTIKGLSMPGVAEVKLSQPQSYSDLPLPALHTNRPNSRSDLKLSGPE